MNKSFFSVLLLGGGMVLFGCRPVSTGQDACDADKGVLLAFVHWAGKTNLTCRQGTPLLRSVWQTPSSAAVEKQTLDRVSAFLATACIKANPPLLNDLVPTAAKQDVPRPASVSVCERLQDEVRALSGSILSNECFLEIYQHTNRSAELLLAVRAGKDHFPLWQSSLREVMSSCSAHELSPAGMVTNCWSIDPQGIFTSAEAPTLRTPAPLFLQWFFLKDWVFVGVSPRTNAAWQQLSAQMKKFSGEAGEGQQKALLELCARPQDLHRSLGLGGGWTNFSEVNLSLSVDTNWVRMTGEVATVFALSVPLEPWSVPTNLIHQPLIGFSAARGLEPLWVGSSNLWDTELCGSVPDQAFLWNLRGPLQTYAAIKVDNAQKASDWLAARLLREAAPWLSANGVGQLNGPTNGNSVVFESVPLFSPYLRPVATNEGNFVFAGILPLNASLVPFPAELSQELRGNTNLLYYDWEFTGPRLQALLAQAQTARLLFHRPQIPRQSASVIWLQSLVPALGNAVTEISCVGTNRLSFVRKSSLGLTAMELNILADWLESPTFPAGVYTLRSTNSWKGMLNGRKRLSNMSFSPSGH